MKKSKKIPRKMIKNEIIKLVSLIDNGIIISRCHKGGKNYYLHFNVRDNDSLNKILDFAEMINCAVQIYVFDDKKYEYRYILVVSPESFDYFTSEWKASLTRFFS